MLSKLSISDKLTLQKILAFICTLSLFVAFRNKSFVIYVVALTLGYSHYLLGAIYRLMSKRKVARGGPLLLIVLGVLVYIYSSNGLALDSKNQLLTLIVTLYAIFHVVVDDQFSSNFFKSKYSYSQQLGCMSLISLLASVQLFQQFNTNFTVVLVFAGLFFNFLYIYSLSREGHSLANYWVLFQISAVYLLIASNLRLGLGVVLYFIGIYHILLFYMHYFTKIASLEKSKNLLHSKKGYLALVFIVNASILIMYAISKTLNISSVAFIFSYNFFLIVNLLHFISSTRFYEFREFFKGSQSLVKLK